MIKLSEVFYSLQGEGITAGTPAVFIRCSKCNLNCGQDANALWKCDTWRLVNQTNLEFTSEQLVQRVASIIPPRYLVTYGAGFHIVFTGGEPLLQPDIIAAVKALKTVLSLAYFEVETNGTISIPDMVFDYVNISPKLSSSGISENRRILPDVLRRALSASIVRTTYKFVIANEQDILETEQIISNYLVKNYESDSDHTRKIQDSIVLMPAMETIEEGKEIKKKVWEWAMERGWKMSLRNHIEVYDKKEGV